VTKDKEEAGDWKDMVDYIGKQDKIISDAKKARQEHQEKIMDMLGSGADFQEYKQRILAKNPELRKKLAVGDTDGYAKDYDKAEESYPYPDFLKEKANEKSSKEVEDFKTKQQQELDTYKKKKAIDAGEDPDATLHPNAPANDPQTKKMRDAIFGSDETPDMPTD
jgi:hypothetical protein